MRVGTFRGDRKPPLDERTGSRRWTPETVRRRVGYHGPEPETVQEKVDAVHDLVADEQVATLVATDLLRRPDVAFQAMTDDTARHQVNHAQVGQAREPSERESPIAPAVKHFGHVMGPWAWSVPASGSWPRPAGSCPACGTADSQMMNGLPFTRTSTRSGRRSLN